MTCWSTATLDSFTTHIDPTGQKMMTIHYNLALPKEITSD